MKGRLKKTEKSWLVETPASVDFTGMPCVGATYEIYPEYLKYYFLEDDDNQKEVEFELISMMQQVREDLSYSTTYAKLIKTNNMEQEKSWLILPMLAYTRHANGDKELFIGWFTKTYSIKF